MIEMDVNGEIIMVPTTVESNTTTTDPITYLPVETPTSSITTTLMNTTNNSTSTSWTLNKEDAIKSVFTTVYSADLNRIIHGLQAQSITHTESTTLLSKLPDVLNESVVTRKPIPHTWPGEASMKSGLLALSILGSPHTAITISHAHRMNLPLPQQYYKGSSYNIKISRKCQLTVLLQLGLIPPQLQQIDNNDERQQRRKGSKNDVDLVHVINLLWKESVSDLVEYITLLQRDQQRLTTRKPSRYRSTTNANDENNINKEAGDCAATNHKSSSILPDEIELGWIKCVYADLCCSILLLKKFIHTTRTYSL